jgi:hypothetical protein
VGQFHADPFGTFAGRDWPHGLRCSECDALFPAGGEINPRRLAGPVVLEPVCSGCVGVVLDRHARAVVCDEVDTADAVRVFLYPSPDTATMRLFGA